MSFLRHLNIFKPSIKSILLGLAKITDIKTLTQSADIKPITIKLSKNIDALCQDLTSNKNIREYSEIIKGLKDLNTLLENISLMKL